MKFNADLNIIVVAVFVLTGWCFYFGFCSPVRSVSYREGVDQVSATPKFYKNRFAFKNEQYKSIPSDSNARLRGKDELDQQKALKKVKSVMPGEKTMWQSDDDDDDDDGGEYEGLDDYSHHDQMGVKKEKSQSCKPQDSVPMMIIREVDMVAMKLPVQDPKELKKDCKAKDSKQKEWSDWSPCSKPCGKGYQSRWRLKNGLQEREQELRPCNLGECANSRDFQLHPSFP